MGGESRGHSSEKRGQGHTKAWEKMMQKAEEDKYGKAIKDPQQTLKKMYDKIMGPQLANLQKKGILNVEDSGKLLKGESLVKKDKKEKKDKPKKKTKKDKKDKKKKKKEEVEVEENATVADNASEETRPP